MENKLRFIKRNIYTLKREYGLPIEIYSITSSSSNLETGAKTVTKVIYRIQRAILLPKKLLQEVIAIFSNNFNNTTIDKQNRIILLDVKDYPNDYEPKPTDYVIISHKRFNIVSLELYDNKLAGVLVVSKVEGQQPAAIITENMKTNISVSEEATHE